MKVSPGRNKGNASVPPWGHLTTHLHRGHRGPWSPQDAGVERLVEQGIGAVQWRGWGWGVEGTGVEGTGCGVALWAWLFGKGIVLVLLTQPGPRAGLGWESATALAGGVIRFPPGLPSRHAPTPYWVEGNRSHHVSSLQYANRSPCSISIRDRLCSSPVRQALSPILQMGKQAHQLCHFAQGQRAGGFNSDLSNRKG